jgi:hypothetical protein
MEVAVDPRDHPETPAADRGAPAVEPDPPAHRAPWGWVLAAAVAAALAAWAVSETGLVRVAPASETFVDMGHHITHSTVKSREAAAVATALRTYAVTGMALGFALGLAGGLSRRSARAAIVASACGLLIGAALGGGSAALGLSVFRRVRYDMPDNLVPSMLVHGWIWAWVGASSGLALGLGLGRRSRIVPSLLGGAIGAAIGAVASLFLAALLPPIADDGFLIAATPPVRLLASVLASVASATFATLAACPAPRSAGRLPARPRSSAH